MNAPNRWRVLEHGPLQKLADNLWLAEGTLPRGPLGRMMTVARRTDGKLVIHNAVALDEPKMGELDQLGEVGWIVVPNGHHRLDCAAYKERYPQANVVCPAGARQRVAQVVEVTGSYDDFPDDDAVALRHLEGVKQREGVMRVRSGAGVTLVFNDTVFNQPHLPGAFGLVVRLMGSSGGPRVTRVARMILVSDKRALRVDLERLATEAEPVRLIPGHGLPVTGDAARTLREIAAGL